VDIIDAFAFGVQFKAMGEDWIQLLTLGTGQFCLAVKASDKMPCQAYVVCKYTNEEWKKKT